MRERIPKKLAHWHVDHPWRMLTITTMMGLPLIQDLIERKVKK